MKPIVKFCDEADRETCIREAAYEGLIPIKEEAGLDSEWYFHPSCSRKTKDHLHKVLTKPALRQMEDNYERALQVAEARAATHKYAIQISAARTGIWQDEEEVCLLCCLVLERGNSIPCEVRFHIGPFDYVIERGNHIRDHIQQSSSDVITEEMRPHNHK